MCRKTAVVAENVVNSLRVAPQWHITAAIAGIYAVNQGQIAMEKLANGDGTSPFTFIASTFVATGLSAYSEFVAFSYTQVYNKMKRIFQRHGWDQRVVVDHVDSYCGRRAAMLAAVDSDFGKEFGHFLIINEFLNSIHNTKRNRS